MREIKLPIKVEIPKDHLYMHRIEAELLLMEVTGYDVEDVFLGEESTTFYIGEAKQY